MNKYLVITCDTTGLNKNDIFNPQVNGTNYYQPITFGLVVVDESFNSIDELYVEIKWDGKSIWENEAQKMHGKSIESLSANGIKEIEAVEEIGSFIFEHFGNGNINLVGCNTVFSRNYLNAMFHRYDVQLKFSSKVHDLNTLGFVLFGANSRDEIFNALDIKKPSTPNALVTSRNITKCFKLIKQLWNTL